MSRSSLSYSCWGALVGVLSVSIACSGSGGGGKGGEGGSAVAGASGAGGSGGVVIVGSGGSGGSGGSAGAAGGTGGSTGGGRGGGAGLCVAGPGMGTKPDTVTFKVNGMPTGFWRGGAGSYQIMHTGQQAVFHLFMNVDNQISRSYVIIDVNIPPGMTSGTVSCGDQMNGEYPFIISYYDDCGHSSYWSGPGRPCSATFTQIPAVGQAGRLVGTFSAGLGGGNFEITDGVIDIDVTPQNI